MNKLLQINVSANWGSHGRIAEDIGRFVKVKGWESYMAYGRFCNPSKLQLLRIGNSADVFAHGIKSFLFDNHGLNSVAATKTLIREIEKIEPHLIHLHNIHGYYLNYSLLFEYLSRVDIPVVWTLHDCWPFTGHCSHPVYAHCEKWKTICSNCPSLHTYPRSLWRDRSRKNFLQKKELFNSIENLTLVTVSKWLDNELSQSFLGSYRHLFIYNGVDTKIFAPSNFNQINGTSDFLVLGVANVWYVEKGLDTFVKLRDLLPSNYRILLVGVSAKQKRTLPKGIESIERTDNIQQLVDLYDRADVFVNPSLAETFGLTTAEALSCGTPVVVYDTTACPELVTSETGKIVPLGDVYGLSEAIESLCNNSSKNKFSSVCRQRALSLFNKEKNVIKYWELYQSIIGK